MFRNRPAKIISVLAIIYLLFGAFQGGVIWYYARGGWDCMPCAKATAFITIMWGPLQINRLLSDE